MDIMIIIFVIISAIIGFLIGKYLTERIRWEDKKKVINTEWKLRLENLDNNYQRQILEIQNNHELDMRKLTHSWELKYTNDLAEIKELIQSAEKYMRHDAISRSKRTLLGKLWEQVSPYLPKFPFKPSDMKFLGSPIDFVVFDGASEDDIKKVIFLEVKSGDSKLSAQERRLKDVIEDGKVSWKLFNIEKPEEIRIQEEKERDEIKDEVPPNEVYNHIDEKISSIKK